MSTERYFLYYFPHRGEAMNVAIERYKDANPDLRMLTCHDLKDAEMSMGNLDVTRLILDGVLGLRYEEMRFLIFLSNETKTELEFIKFGLVYDPSQSYLERRKVADELLRLAALGND